MDCSTSPGKSNHACQSYGWNIHDLHNQNRIPKVSSGHSTTQRLLFLPSGSAICCGYPDSVPWASGSARL